jgi:hypothetical protein
MLEGQAVEPQRNRDAADEGGVVLADENHFLGIFSFCLHHSLTPRLRG